MAHILRARDFGNVVTLSSDEGKGHPVQKFLISYFYITKSILISQNALDFVLSQIRFLISKIEFVIQKIKLIL